MKKLLSSILCLAICCTVLCACGDSKDKDTNQTTSAQTTTEETTTEKNDDTTVESSDETETTETTTEPTTDEETTQETENAEEASEESDEEKVSEDTQEQTSEETSVENSEEPIEEDSFDKEEAVAKIDKLIEAHDVLLDQNDEFVNDLLYGAETLSAERDPDIETSDGINIKGKEVDTVIVINYFYDYINNDGGYYDLKNYIQTHTYKEINEKYLFSGHCNFWSTEVILKEAIGLIPYMKQSDNIEYGDLVEENEITMEHADVAYSMTIKCDDHGGDFIAVYDIKGNLLNVFPIDDNWDNYVFTF